MKIIDNLQAAQDAIAADIAASEADGTKSALAESVRKAAVEAITGGVSSVKWLRYMALFCDDANQLAQLTVARKGDEDYMPQIRAYTAANAVCLPDTNTRLTNGVADKNIEPPAGGDTNGVPAPEDVRDDALFQKLRPQPQPQPE